ncbi:MAG: lytic transglycosylase domain-containing protein [bacterium]
MTPLFKAPRILPGFMLLLLLFACLPASAKPSSSIDRQVKETVKIYTNFILDSNPSLDRRTAEAISWSIIYYSYYYGIPDARLVVAMIIQESGFQPDAVSRCGAMGIGQLMPETADALGVENPFEPVSNIRAMVRILRLNLERFSHLPYPKMYQNAIAAYNAGYGAVLKYGGIPPYPETINYVNNVILLWRRLCGLR